jgi:hypothetical protein
VRLAPEMLYTYHMYWIMTALVLNTVLIQLDSWCWTIFAYVRPDLNTNYLGIYGMDVIYHIYVGCVSDFDIARETIVCSLKLR